MHDSQLPDTGTVFHAGFPNASEDASAVALSLDSLLVRRAASTFMWQLADDTPERGWRRGDIAVVDRSLPPRHGDVVVAVIAEEFCLRNYCRSGRGPVELRCLDGGACDNYEETSPLLWGVVTAVVQPLRLQPLGDDPTLNRRRT